MISIRHLFYFLVLLNWTDSRNLTTFVRFDHAIQSNSTLLKIYNKIKVCIDERNEEIYLVHP